MVSCTGLAYHAERKRKRSTRGSSERLDDLQESFNCTFGEYTGGFLERRRRDERLGCQRGFGDTQQYTFAFGCDLLSLTELLVFFQERGVFHLITRNKAAVAVLSDEYFTQHLTDDDFDVLVIDAYTLQSVNFLNFVGDVHRQIANAFQTQDM